MIQVITRSQLSKSAGWCAVIAVLVASCYGSPTGFDLNSQLDPINDVMVYAGSFWEFAEVDDTITIDAFGYHNGSGFGTQLIRTVTWASSDVATLRVVQSKTTGIGSFAQVKGIKPGIVTLSVTLNGVTGSDTLRVIPRVKQLALKSSAAVLAIGDTVEIWCRADDLNGDSIPNLRPLIGPDFLLPYPFPLRYIGPYPRHRYVSTDTGSVGFVTGVAHDTARVTVRVMPRTP